ncbi:hypothetical protein MJT46_018707, partial [Ovis ammon polii x Ovis aries]
GKVARKKGIIGMRKKNKQTLTLAVLTEPHSDTCTCLYGEPKHTATLRLIILKATLEDQRNVSVMERVRATLLWHALGLQMVPSGHAKNDTRDGRVDTALTSVVLLSRKKPPERNCKGERGKVTEEYQLHDSRVNLLQQLEYFTSAATLLPEHYGSVTSKTGRLLSQPLSLPNEKPIGKVQERADEGLRTDVMRKGKRPSDIRSTQSQENEERQGKAQGFKAWIQHPSQHIPSHNHPASGLLQLLAAAEKCSEGSRSEEQFIETRFFTNSVAKLPKKEENMVEEIALNSFSSKHAFGGQAPTLGTEARSVEVRPPPQSGRETMYWGSGSFRFVYPVIVMARGMHLCSRPIRLRMTSLLSRARRKVALAPVSHRSRRASEQEREDQDAALSHDSRRFGAERGSKVKARYLLKEEYEEPQSSTEFKDNCFIGKVSNRICGKSLKIPMRAFEIAQLKTTTLHTELHSEFKFARPDLPPGSGGKFNFTFMNRIG